MNLSNVTLSMYRYRVASMKITIGNSDDTESENIEMANISSIKIENRYEDYYFPFFVINATIPNAFYREIIKPDYSDTIIVNLQLQVGEFSEKDVGPDSKVSWRNVIHSAFKGVISSKEPETTEEVQERAEDEGLADGSNTELEISLYPKSYFANYNRVVNAVLRNVKPIDVLTYLLNKAKLNKILVSPPSNNKRYKQFMLIPISAHKMITRLCETYALHKKGSIVFFDHDRGYIIAREPACSAYEQGEYHTVYVVMQTTAGSTSMVGGAYEDEENEYYVLNVANASFGNNKSITEKAAGKNTVIVSQEGKVTKTNKKATVITSVATTTEGESTAAAIKQGLKESSNGLKVAFKEVDISMLTPNRIFIVSIEGASYKKYNGRYRMSSCIHNFAKEGDYFICNSEVELRGSGSKKKK